MNLRHLRLQHLCAALLAAVYLAALFAGTLAPASYEQQFRDFPAAAPSGDFPLGTDALGRDRLSRLLYGSRVSLVLAPAAALIAVAGAALAGGAAAMLGGRWERLLLQAADLTLSLPWILLLITVRAALPLNVSPAVSVTITFALLGLLGWAGPARVVRAGFREIIASDYVLAARGRGVRPLAILFRHILPNVRPVLAAQFWTAIPVFIVAEANLGLLGLGVSEPLPSWGSLLKDLESQASALTNPLDSWWLLAPVALLIVVVLCFQGVAPSEVTQ
jgi:peptide/nickel transport system permease protein